MKLKKQKYLPYAYLLMLLVCFSNAHAQQTVKTTGNGFADENKKVDMLLGQFAKGKLPPFSFIMGGKKSNVFIKDWSFAESKKTLDSNRTQHIYIYTNPEKTMEVRSVCTVYSDYPAIEWVLHFKNTSAANSPILDSVNTIDTKFNYAAKKQFTLHLARGSSADRTDFAPIDATMQVNADNIFGPDQGRSSDTDVLPFFNMDAGDEGFISGIGWTGRWLCKLKRDSLNMVSFTAGFRKLRTYLLPNEEIRTPEVLLFFWKDADRMTGHNLFRRFILKHHTPQKDGKPVTLPLAFNPSGSGPSPCNENSCTTEEYAITMMNRYSQFGLKLEDFWIDAGWYEGSQESWYRGVGNWTINKTNFPNGFKPISDAAKKQGMGFVLWFEPERVFKGTRLDREHPEWEIKLKDHESATLNLGLEGARRWVTDYVSSMIDKEGITVYRQDFNFDPLPYWESADKPDREGMTELRHIEGLYMFWDELLAKHPGLLIDNCASGGRRIDLETISRSVPLWRTDYQYFEPNGYQCHTYGLNLYLPCSGTGNINPDPYKFRSAMSSALIVGWGVSQGDFQLAQAKTDLEEYKRLRPFFYADYYPLTDYDAGDDAFMSYQFNRPENNDGVVFAFRRSQNAKATVTVKLKGLNPVSTYDVNFEDYGIIENKTGKELMEKGIDIKIPAAPGSLIVSYLKK